MKGRIDAGETPEATTCYAVKGLDEEHKALLKEQPSPDLFGLLWTGTTRRTVSPVPSPRRSGHRTSRNPWGTAGDSAGNGFGFGLVRAGGLLLELGQLLVRVFGVHSRELVGLKDQVGDRPAPLPRLVHVLRRVAHPDGGRVQHADVLGDAPRRLDATPQALLLAALCGRTAVEISEIESIPLGTAKTRIRTGMQKVRASMARRRTEP